MEKKLEKMRNEIKTRLHSQQGLLAIVVILLGASASGVLPVKLESEQAADFISGFQIGILSAMAVIVLYQMVRYLKALKDDTCLKQIYYKEHDERMCCIEQKVGKSCMGITLVLMIVAAVIAGYFSEVVFFTLLGSAALQALIGLGLKFYYIHSFSGEETN